MTPTRLLSLPTVKQIDRLVGDVASPQARIFVLLDASTLTHIPLHVASHLLLGERIWRRKGVCAFWVGLSPYLTDLLALAAGTEQLPSLPDLPTAT